MIFIIGDSIPPRPSAQESSPVDSSRRASYFRGRSWHHLSMPIPQFIIDLRARIGRHPLWLIGVTAVVIRDDGVLLVERADNGIWTPVTGIVDPGEEPADAAVREVAEETGVTAVPDHSGADEGTHQRRARRARGNPVRVERWVLEQRGQTDGGVHRQRAEHHREIVVRL